MLGHLPFVGSRHSRLLASQLWNVLECAGISVGCGTWAQWGSASRGWSGPTWDLWLGGEETNRKCRACHPEAERR